MPLVHVFGLLALLVALAMSLAGMQPPAAVLESAPPELFSASRAMAHVREISKKPHPVGSVAHDEARDYLLTRLKELGLQPEIQKTTSTQQSFGRFAGAVVENVMARVVSRGSDHRAVLLAAHYDSVPHSPGAGDDGIGTAALLEAARAIVQGPALDRDVIVLFTDGEELGLLGAEAFVSESPASREVVSAFNFDARGDKGSVAMFDASDDASQLLVALKRVPHVQANSFVSALAKLLPNDTDATVFKKAGIPTMSFAVADGFENYHRATDSADRLDPRSLQAMGDAAVALSRELGRGALPTLDGEEVAYFTLFGRSLHVVQFKTAIIAALAALIFTLMASMGVVRRRLTTRRGLGLGVLASLGAMLAAGVAGYVLNLVSEGAGTADMRLVRCGSLAIAAVTVSLLAAVYAFRSLRKVGVIANTMGALCILSVVSLGLSVTPASAACLPFVATSLLGALFAMTTVILGHRAPLVRTAVLYAAATGACLVWFPTLYSVMIAAAANTTVPIAVLALPVVLLVAPTVATARARTLVALTAAAALIVAIQFIRISWPMPEVPHQSTLMYGVDADRKQGFFFASEVMPWMSPVLSADTAKRRPLPAISLLERDWFVGEAEVSGLPGAVLEKSERKLSADGIEISTTIHPTADSRCFSVWDESRRIVDVASVASRPVRRRYRFSKEKDAVMVQKFFGRGVRPAFVFQFCAAHGEPIDVVFVASAADDQPIPIRLVEITDGVPPAMGGTFATRPEGEIPTDDSDRTVVEHGLKL